MYKLQFKKFGTISGDEAWEVFQGLSGNIFDYTVRTMSGTLLGSGGLNPPASGIQLEWFDYSPLYLDVAVVQSGLVLSPHNLLPPLTTDNWYIQGDELAVSHIYLSSGTKIQDGLKVYPRNLIEHNPDFNDGLNNWVVSSGYPGAIYVIYGQDENYVRIENYDSSATGDGGLKYGISLSVSGTGYYRLRARVRSSSFLQKLTPGSEDVEIMRWHRKFGTTTVETYHLRIPGSLSKWTWIETGFEITDTTTYTLVSDYPEIFYGYVEIDKIELIRVPEHPYDGYIMPKLYYGDSCWYSTASGFRYEFKDGSYVYVPSGSRWNTTSWTIQVDFIARGIEPTSKYLFYQNNGPFVMLSGTTVYVGYPGVVWNSSAFSFEPDKPYRIHYGLSTFGGSAYVKAYIVDLTTNTATKFADTSSATLPPGSTDPLYFGAKDDGTDYFEGTIAHVLFANEIFNGPDDIDYTNLTSDLLIGDWFIEDGYTNRIKNYAHLDSHNCVGLLTNNVIVLPPGDYRLVGKFKRVDVGKSWDYIYLKFGLYDATTDTFLESKYLTAVEFHGATKDWEYKSVDFSVASGVLMRGLCPGYLDGELYIKDVALYHYPTVVSGTDPCEGYTEPVGLKFNRVLDGVPGYGYEMRAVVSAEDLQPWNAEEIKQFVFDIYEDNAKVSQLYLTIPSGTYRYYIASGSYYPTGSGTILRLVPSEPTGFTGELTLHSLITVPVETVYELPLNPTIVDYGHLNKNKTILKTIDGGYVVQSLRGSRLNKLVWRNLPVDEYNSIYYQLKQWEYPLTQGLLFRDPNHPIFNSWHPVRILDVRATISNNTYPVLYDTIEVIMEILPRYIPAGDEAVEPID